MATIITLRDARGNEVDFSVDIDPEHQGLIPIMNRARRAKTQRASAAGGAIKVRVVAERLATV